LKKAKFFPKLKRKTVHKVGMRKLLILSILAIEFQTQAILSPTAQAAFEVQKIFISKEIYEAFGGPDFITTCEKTDTGYLLFSHDQKMHVKVIYETQEKIEPKKSQLQFGPLEPIQD
jgi:hypothetical protein